MLPKNEKEALVDVDDRIAMLERRLDNAKAARDAFVHHLRGKYPTWKPPLPTMSYQEADFPKLPHYASNHHREPLLSRLSTSDYQWDITNNRNNRSRSMTRLSSKFQPMDIPTSGPLLESDIRRSKIRLREISEELRAMRIDRMSLSTDQWLQEQPFRQHKYLRLNLTENAAEPQIDHLEQARAHLSRINLTETSPIATPTEERKIDISMTENHEKLLAEMRAQAPPTTHVTFQEAPPTQTVVPPVLQEAPPVIAPPTEPVAPPTSTQAPPIAAQAPPTSSVSNLLAQLAGGSDSDDSPRIPAPAATQNLDYSKFLSNLGVGGGMSSDEDDNAFSRPSYQKSRPAVGKSMAAAMMADEDSDVDDFFR
ncbi:Verprolin [Caenorhabditis elegans]|uniref:Verprolin n=1 Tax=Caenorhabditis elegans TaxID=6239 RepID=Q9NET8_CAEEL|nr:Verprolin [Caenorhabditis elegans]CAC51066.1 Verprolin [Caenorhabditis elegans]|eukprot:NP_741687.1 Uncharacterized protein CELE_Y39B6A.11 [Caenorhabditis elegans]